MEDLDQKIADIKSTLRSVSDLESLVAKLFGDDAYVSVGKSRPVIIQTNCLADEHLDIVVAGTNEYLNGEG